jgi:hypothetical protein
MKQLATFTLILVFGLTQAQNRVTHYEYWFNSNYQGRLHTNITPAALVNFQGSFPTTGLSDGLNILHLHFGDDSGRYSTPLSQFFIRRTPSATASGRISAYQYWIDDQFSANVLQTVTPVANLNLNTAFDVNGLSNGIHILNLRFRDNTGLWTHPISQFFYKSASVPGAATNEITHFQYWFDNDVQLAVTEQVDATAQLTFTRAISTASIHSGLHILHLRFRDIKGHWSNTSDQFVYIHPKPANTDSNLLSKMQYWFDDDFQQVVTKYIAAKALVQVNDLLAANALADGLHRINVRVGDTIGHWSPTISQFFFKSDGSNINNNVITGYRYWFNNDQQDKMVVHTTPAQSVVTLNTSIDMGCLAAGSNRLHLQFQDKVGLWSIGTTDTLTVFLPPSNIYRFTGNGNWSNPANWQNGYYPALDLPGCKEIIIDHVAGGACVLDVPQNLLKNAKLTVLPGKHLVISGQLRIK